MTRTIHLALSLLLIPTLASAAPQDVPVPENLVAIGVSALSFDPVNSEVGFATTTGTPAAALNARKFVKVDATGWKDINAFHTALLVAAADGQVVFTESVSNSAETIDVRGTQFDTPVGLLKYVGLTKLQFNHVTRGVHVTAKDSPATTIADDEDIRVDDVIISFTGLDVWKNEAEAKLRVADASALSDVNVLFGGARTREVRLASEDTMSQLILKTTGLTLVSAGGFVSVKASDGEAEESGLRSKDEFLRVDGRLIKELPRFLHAVWKSLLEKDGSVTFMVRLNGSSKPDRTITLPRPLAPAAASPASSSQPLQSLPRGIQGKTGPHQEFPTQVPIPGAETNALADEVITARVELHYYRDAHRVSQIINRRVESYNAAEVTRYARAAEDARDRFEQSRIDRKAAEENARQASRDLREDEERLAIMVGELRRHLLRRRSIESQINTIDDELKTLTESAMDTDGDGVPDLDAAATTRKSQLEEQKARLQRERDVYQASEETTEALQEQVQSLLKSIETQRAELVERQAESRKADATEQLAAKEQFRREVSAGTIDPDTYVAGNLESKDPVTQVSISVIGEGVIHLRGPRRGVTAIRRMIDEIDHPVAQVKIGVMTMQVNGRAGSSMDNTIRRMEGHLSRGRFLTYVSEQLFRRSVSEVAARVAAMSQESGTINPDLISKYSTGIGTGNQTPLRSQTRWASYLTEFFGHDFLEELREVYDSSVVIDPFNKLVSLSSVDTTTLADAVLITSLAKANYRREIFDRFDFYLQAELPRMDAQWIKTNRIKKSWDPRHWDDPVSEKKVIADGQLRYRFDAFKSVFERSYGEAFCPTDAGWETMVDDRLNPMQREIVKLVQGMTLQQLVQREHEALVLKRHLIERAGTTLNPAQAYLVDSQITSLDERYCDAMEALRGRKAAIDRVLKQAVVALEDDVYAQFYNPTIERMQRSAQEWGVDVGAVERTTILTNNRSFAKVDPQATYEFDLPKRDILIAEALKSAYALHKDIGPLLGDPDFATLAKMFAGQSIGGSSADGMVKNVLPGLPSSTDQEMLLQTDGAARPQFGTELEKLIPDPAIYKFETGTGFEVRPVVQPDGQSVMFDFDYMYSTDLLEPTRPDEKQLGRVKRHFVHTEVQLSNLEWREISRYEVALKATRRSRGVPLLEDVPLLGVAFRPLPQGDKSIQKNIIIGQAVIYPTIQDLLGLRPGQTARMNVAGVGERIDELWNENEETERTVRDLLDLKVREALGGQELPQPPLPGQFPILPQSHLETRPAGSNGYGAAPEPLAVPSDNGARSAIRQVPGVSSVAPGGNSWIRPAVNQEAREATSAQSRAIQPTSYFEPAQAPAASGAGRPVVTPGHSGKPANSAPRRVIPSSPVRR